MNWILQFQDDEALLGSLPIEAEGFRLHVTGDEHRVNELEDVSNVQKFELTPDEYSKKTGTVQDFLKKNKMGKYNPEEMKRLEEEKTAQDKEETELASKIKVDDRCEVKMPGNPTRRGTVKYVGEVSNYLLILQTKPLWALKVNGWIGIEGVFPQNYIYLSGALWNIYIFAGSFKKEYQKNK